MKVTRVIKTELELNLEITETTLLTVEEVEKLPERLKEYKNWWWLKSPGSSSDYAACVHSNGTVLSKGVSVWFYCSVRPALVISNLESSNLQIGNTFEFDGKQFEIISNNKAFCLTDIGMSAFRKDSETSDANDYEKSDVKKFIDYWFKNNIEEVNNKENEIKETNKNEPLYKCKDCISESRCPCDPNSGACGCFYPKNIFLVKTLASLLEKLHLEENKPLSPQERDVLLHLIEKDLNKRKY